MNQEEREETLAALCSVPWDCFYVVQHYSMGEWADIKRFRFSENATDCFDQLYKEGNRKIRIVIRIDAELPQPPETEA